MSEVPEAFGPYLVYEQLGVGGMARVHRAEVADRTGFHRPIALKRMLPHAAANLEMVKSFVREAHLASHLHHANVAQTYELGKVDDIYFIAMELIIGRNLREILRQCAVTTGPMPVAVALNILNQICDALDYAHNLCDERGKQLGIIHRDVSPSNVIVAEGGVVKLIDFGIAKVTSASMQTMSGTVKGKFGYMAPEYLAGRIDARADLFAVGVIAHELLTNRPLFSTPDDMETLNRVRTMDIQPPSQRNPQVPPEVDDVVMTALARDPDRRWQHATALRTAMTTLTGRLGLVISNQQAIEWIDWAFEQTRQRGGPAPAPAPAPTDEDPSMSIQLGTSSAAPGASGYLTTVSEPPSMVPGDPSPRTSIDPEREVPRHEAVPPPPVRMSAPESSAPPSLASVQMTLVGTVPARRSSPSEPPPSRVPERPNRTSEPPPSKLDPPARIAPSEPAAPAHDPGFVEPNRPRRPTPAMEVAPRPKGGTAMVVVLVLLAAAIAAAATYFLLPLVT